MSNAASQWPWPPVTLSRTQTGGWSSSRKDAICWTLRLTVLMPPWPSCSALLLSKGAVVGGARGPSPGNLSLAEPRCAQNLSSLRPWPGVCVGFWGKAGSWVTHPLTRRAADARRNLQTVGLMEPRLPFLCFLIQRLLSASSSGGVPLPQTLNLPQETVRHLPRGISG